MPRASQEHRAHSTAGERSVDIVAGSLQLAPVVVGRSGTDSRPAFVHEEVYERTGIRVSLTAFAGWRN